MRRVAASFGTKLIVTCWYRRGMRFLILIALIAAFFAGCGYKGPLYVPGAKAEAKKPAAVVTPEPAPARPVPAESAPPPK